MRLCRCVSTVRATDVQSACDGPTGMLFGDQLEHFPFSGGELVEFAPSASSTH